MTAISDSHLRVRPRVWIGLVVYVAYVAIVFAVQKFSGVPYTEFDADGGNLFLGAGVSLIVGAVLLAITTSLLGWWGPALHERQRAEARWPIVAAGLMGLGVLANLVSTDWGSYDAAFFGASLVLLLVGFTEELTTRGLLVVGLRSRLSEVWVWLISSVLFGVMHLVNALNGAPIGSTITQVFFAAGAGTVFYVLRRVTGNLVWAMVLHALWDFAVFGVGRGNPGPLRAVGGVLEIVAIVVALVALPSVIRGARERLDHEPIPSRPRDSAQPIA